MRVCAGVDLWKRNLQLLVPFLVQPKITLYSTDIRQGNSPPEVEVRLHASVCQRACAATRHLLQACCQQPQPQPQPQPMARSVLCSWAAIMPQWLNKCLASALLVPVDLTQTQRRSALTVSCCCLQAAWQLATWLSLPWKPYVEIEGRTVYTLNSDGNQVRLCVAMLHSPTIACGEVGACPALVSSQLMCVPTCLWSAATRWSGTKSSGMSAPWRHC